MQLLSCATRPVLSAKNSYHCSSYKLKKTRGFHGGSIEAAVVPVTAIGDTRKQENITCSYETNVATNLDAISVISIKSNNDVEIRSSSIKAERIQIRATDKVSFTLQKLTNAYNKSTAGRNLVYQKSETKGHTKEHVEYSKIEGHLEIDSEKVELQIKEEDLKNNPKFYVSGINIKLESDDNLRERVNELSAIPGMGWIKSVAEHENVNIIPVELAYDSWKKTQEGLTPEGAVIVAVAVTAATGGAGSAIVGSAVTNTAALAAINAGVTTLATQASISLINNQGNLNAVFEDMQKDENVKAVVTSIITAGVTQGVHDSLQTAERAKEAITTLEQFAHHTQEQLINNTIRLATNSAIHGSDFREGIVPALRVSVVDALGATIVNEIGKSYKAYIQEGGRDTLSYLSHKIAHGVLGCQLARGQGGDCEAGAFGAVFTEILLDQPENDMEYLLEFRLSTLKQRRKN